MDGHEDEADDAVAAERGQHALEVGADDLGGNSQGNSLKHFLKIFLTFKFQSRIMQYILQGGLSIWSYCWVGLTMILVISVSAQLWLGR